MADEIAHEHANFTPTVRKSHFEETVGGGCGDSSAGCSPILWGFSALKPSWRVLRPGSATMLAQLCNECDLSHTSTSVIMSGCRCLYLTRLTTSVDSSVQLGAQVHVCRMEITKYKLTLSPRTQPAFRWLFANSSSTSCSFKQAPRVTTCGPSNDGSDKIYSSISSQIKSNH